jgi:osmotically-inducible protein OsmY
MIMRSLAHRALLAWMVFAVALVLSSAPAGAASVSDAWVTTKTKMKLLSSDLGSMTHVNVDTTDGRVTLHGVVASQAEKAKAQEIAHAVEGVRDVRNLLQVVPKRQAEIVKVGDSDLKKRVSEALERDPALSDSDIRVESVSSGVVLLEGEAKTLSDHRRALEVAARVPGVNRVASQVRSPDHLADEEIWYEGSYDAARSAGSSARDMWITSAVKMRLLANSETPAIDINVDTSDGVVTLFGSVPTDAAKQAAAAEARRIGGVRSVENELQVVSKTQQDRVASKDGDIENAIEQRLEARSDLADSKIGVEVSNGVARLTGSVESQGDRLTALTVARATSGVRAVIDDLTVNPPAVSAR